MRFHSIVRVSLKTGALTPLIDDVFAYAGRVCALAALLSLGQAVPSMAQSVDCARLQQQIALADSGGGDQIAAAARKQNIEIARTAAYGHQLGCDRQSFGFFGGGPPPQCAAINTRLAQMQANLGQLQAGARGGGRAALVSRFNTYCRGGAPQQQAARQPVQPRGFFESLFGGGQEERPAPPPAAIPIDPADASDQPIDDPDAIGVHGGSQAVCVRTCDGGFFPLPLSSHHSGDSLNEMCAALCPGTEAAVYTRNPNNEIKTAVSLDGTPYMDLPNALKFQKSFDTACTCRPAGKSWADALANAESVLGNQRKGDILVTPEKSAELSRPKMDAKTKSSLLRDSDVPATPPVPASAQGQGAATAQADAPIDKAAAGQLPDSMGPDGLKRHVRQVGPQL